MENIHQYSQLQSSSFFPAQVIIIGGCYDTNSRRVVALRDMWRLNVRTLQWTAMQTALLPNATYFHDAALTSYGLMYLFGGIERKLLAGGPESRSERTNDVYQVWVRVTRLAEISWAALAFLYPQMGGMSEERLMAAGVPKQFVQRLPGYARRKAEDRLFEEMLGEARNDGDGDNNGDEEDDEDDDDEDDGGDDDDDAESMDEDENDDAEFEAEENEAEEEAEEEAEAEEEEEDDDDDDLWEDVVEEMPGGN